MPLGAQSTARARSPGESQSSWSRTRLPEKGFAECGHCPAHGARMLPVDAQARQMLRNVPGTVDAEGGRARPQADCAFQMGFEPERSEIAGRRRDASRPRTK